PLVTRSSRSCTAESSCAAGTTRLTRPQSSAVRASMTSPDMASSAARLRPTFLATATIGVWQNHPPLPPGVAKPAFSLATARSAVATSWQPAAVASPCTRATTGWGTCWISVISSVQVTAGDLGEVVPGTEHRAVPGQHDAEGIAVAELTERGDQLAHVLQGQGVAALRPVHRDRG